MNCYTVEYSHRFGVFHAPKWASDEAGALSAVQSKHAEAGLSQAVGMITYRRVTLVNPQPFGGVVCPPPGKSLAVGTMNRPDAGTAELDFGAKVAA